MNKTPALYTIPAGVSFLDTLAKGLFERVGENKEQLADMRILLPTRRGCRGLREAFLRQTNGAPIILPHMQPIGDVDQDEISITANVSTSKAGQKILSIKPAISSLHRTILLAQLVRKVDGFAFSDEQAFGLAEALGNFIDQIHTEGLNLSSLDDLVPSNLATHWNINLKFLNILKDAWPVLLDTYGMIDGGLRRRLLMETMAEYWQETPPQSPIIVAGTTGSIPATAQILETVLSLPQGEVILPGLDKILDTPCWDEVTAGHPQFTLKRLIDNLNIEREHIEGWPDMASHIPQPNPNRMQFVSELMRPAETVHKWQTLTPFEATATDGLIQCECDNPDEEAHVVALIMREVLEDPDQEKTAALITPDRFLGRRVEAILNRWDIQINDSAGVPLAESNIGRFIIAVLDVIEKKQTPIALLTLLKHPLCSAGQTIGWGNAFAKALEMDGCIRGTTPVHGLTSLAQRTKDENIKGDIEHFATLLEPLITRVEKGLYNQTTKTSFLKSLLTHFIKTLESLSATTEDPKGQILWQGEAGEAASQFFAELLTLSDDMPALNFRDWKAIIINQMGRLAVRPKFGAHPRLSIYGQIEARLVQTDVVILGSLNEGTWPSAPATDPWMSRPMRNEMGLPSPEQAVTLAAHDFAQGITAPEVFITRAKKSAGNPTVPSRWLQRLSTVCKSTHLETITNDGDKYVHWARQLNHWDQISVPATRPAPKPPLDARPKRLSVTDIEKLISDPYEIYAKHVLNLRPLEPLEEDLSAKDRGTFIHAVLDHFIKQHPKDLPDNAEDILLSIGQDKLKDIIENPEVWASWWPRFERMATWFIGHEQDWRAQGYSFFAGEEKAITTIENIDIVGRCDRIDLDRDGNAAIIDYKTGGQYSGTNMLRGFTPQLPVEGLMVENGAFKDLPPAEVSYLGYWVISGLKKGGETSQTTEDTRTKTEDVMESARAGFPALLIAFQDPNMPYLSLPFAGKEPRYQNYDHLARVAEWSTNASDQEAA